MGTAFNVLVLLHVLCVVGGFGAVAYNGLYASLARRRSGGGASAVIDTNILVSGLAEMLIYAALLFGIGAVTASHSMVKFSDAWVSAAFAVYLVEIGILHGWIRRHQRSYSGLVRAMEEATGRQPASGSDVALLHRLEKRVVAGWGVFNLLVVGAVYLMVFRPGN